MEFTEPIIGVEEFTALTSMCCKRREELGKVLLNVLDLGEVKE